MKPNEFQAIHADAYEAIEYFYQMGMIENLHGDAAHYLDALIKYTAHKMHIELG